MVLIARTNKQGEFNFEAVRVWCLFLAQLAKSCGVATPAACVAQGTVKLIKEPAGRPESPETGSGTRRESAEPDDLNIITGNTAFRPALALFVRRRLGFADRRRLDASRLIGPDR